MLKIRLQRVGRKSEPTFRLVLTDSKNSTKSGKYLETLGNYDARRGEKSEFKADRISYWLSQGAQASGTVYNLLVEKKIVTGKKVNVLPLKKAIVKESPAGESAPVQTEATEVSSEGAAETISAEEVPSSTEAEAPKEETKQVE